METVRRVVPVDWTDYNGHMNEGRYGQVFSDAADGFMLAIGADQEYVAGGHSFFTVETTIKYLLETHAGEDIVVDTRVLLADGKKVNWPTTCAAYPMAPPLPVVNNSCCTCH